jgi:hypothetical protein
MSTLLPINEVITVSDAPVLTMSTLLPINETITTSDAPALTQSTVLPINETITVSDAPMLTTSLIATSTTLGITGSPILLGAQETFTVSVAPSAATGTVNLYDSGTLLAPITLANGAGIFITTGLAVGVHTLYATYQGNTAYAASTSSTVRVVVLAPLTVTAQNASRNFATANPALTYTVSGFINGDTAAVLTGAPTLSTTAQLNSLAGGYPIAIAQGTLSAPSYYSVNLVNGTLTVNGNAPQTIDFVLPATVSLAQHPRLKLTAVSSSGLPITYTLNSGPATLSGNILTLTGTGTVTVTASQSGSTTFAPAASVAQSFTVTR